MAVLRVAAVFPIFLLSVCVIHSEKLPYFDLERIVMPECTIHTPLALEKCSNVSDDCNCGTVNNRKVVFCSPEDFLYIPAFPFEIDTFCIETKDLLDIEDADFFTNVSSVSALGIFARFETTSPAAFKRLTNLKRLTLVRHETFLAHILEAAPMLSGLAMIDCAISSFSADGLEHLDFLDMSDNFVEIVHLDPAFIPITLRRADFSYNRLHAVTGHTVLPNLEELVLAHNGLHSFPETCSDSGESYLPNLLMLDLKYNKIRSIPDEPCLPRLLVLNFDGNSVIFLQYSVSLTADMFPSLRYASFAKTFDESISEFTDFEFIDMPSLTSVRLTYTGLFDIWDLTQSFVNCSQLRFLDVSFNLISDEYIIPVPLHPDLSLQRVSFLNLSGCELGSNSHPTALSTFISILPNLETLDLSNNQLHFIASGLFDRLLNLRQLYLFLNSLTVVSPDMFSAATRDRLETLNFAINPFVCSCDILWFQSWVASSPNKFLDTSFYWCETGDRVPEMPLLDFKLSEQACLLSHEAYVAITYIILFTLLFSVITVSVWRFKWHLRLLLYDMFRGPGDARRLRLQHGHFDYDVFVSYDSDDQLWVFGKLVPELEGRLGLKLCVHERDFVPGTQIIDNIAKRVEASKKILMVWSRSFVDSKWCQFELTFCLQHTMDTEDALVIVCLDDVTSTNDITPAMMAVLKTTTYIQWVGERRGKDALDSFWGRLRVALQEVIPEAEHQV